MQHPPAPRQGLCCTLGRPLLSALGPEQAHKPTSAHSRLSFESCPWTAGCQADLDHLTKHFPTVTYDVQSPSILELACLSTAGPGQAGKQSRLAVSLRAAITGKPVAHCLFTDHETHKHSLLPPPPHTFSARSQKSIYGKN